MSDMVQAPHFEGYEVVGVRHPQRDCGDYVLSPFGKRLESADYILPEYFRCVQVVYRKLPEPKPEVVCGRCGWEGSTVQLLRYFTESRFTIYLCPICHSGRIGLPRQAGGKDMKPEPKPKKWKGCVPEEIVLPDGEQIFHWFVRVFTKPRPGDGFTLLGPQCKTRRAAILAWNRGLP